MSTLLLRLAAPLQSWGADSKYESVRGTGREPSKSGVVGLLAAALGRPRDADLSDLNALRFGIRADQEGQELRDYHSAHTANGKDSYITNRYYLADACFVVGLESANEAFLRELEQALKNPAFSLFLGRRSCPPEQPLVLGIRTEELLAALQNEPWQASEYMQRQLTRFDKTVRLRIRIDAAPSKPGAKIRDKAISFDPTHRRFGYRNAAETMVTLQEEHDPMKELR